MTRTQTPEPTRTEPATVDRWGWDVLVLLALSIWVVGVRLSDAALVDPDEPRSALIARRIAERGDWPALYLPAVFRHDYPADPVQGDGVAYWDKPPLYFWLAALAMKALGPTALAVRLPSALSHVATVLLVYAAGRAARSRRAGLLAGAVMAVSPLPLIMGHVARPDALLVALLTAAMLAIVRLLHDRPGSWRWTAVLYVSVGLGVLTKGLLAIAFPAAAVVAVAVLRGRWSDLRRLRPLAGLGIVLLVAAPWFVYMHVRYPPGSLGGSPGFSYVFFVTQHWLRATADDFGGHEHVPGYLLGVLLVGFLPWTVFLPAACVRLVRQAWRERRSGASGPAIVALLVAWSAVVVVAFSISRTQLAYYVTPAIPPLAVLVGLYLAEKTASAERERLFTFGVWVTVVFGVGAAGAVVWYVVQSGLRGLPDIALAALCGVTLAAGAVAIARRRRGVWAATAVATAASLVTFVFAADPFDVYGSYTTYGESQILAASVRPGDRVIAFPYTPYSLAWYLWPRNVGQPAADGNPGPGSSSLPDLVRALNQPQRTFCVIQKKAALEAIRPEIRWPIRVLSKRPRHTLIVTDPPKAEADHGR